VQIGGEVKDDEFDPVPHVTIRKSLKLMGRTSQFAVVAADQAVRDAELEMDKIDPERIGVCIGSGPAGEPFGRHARAIIRARDENGEFSMPEYWAAAQSALDPMDYLRRLPNMPSCNIAINHQILGPNNTVASACAAGTQAIGEAFRTIQCGNAEVMLAGGADTRIQPEGIVRFSLLGVLSKRNDSPECASRPFDASRDGFVLGEGAGVIVLEELNHAKRRGARIYCELVGYGSSCDAYRLTDAHPEGRGGAAAMNAALRDAGIPPSKVDYINAHGTSTILNDRVETVAIKRVFGSDAYKVAVSSTKSMTGHLISAAGALEFVACVLAMEHGVLPPTINYDQADPLCDLDYVPNRAREAQIDVIMSNSFAFGGQNSVVVMKSF
jgi:3-oxoacyl-[acyl-carrier-protein] synthase II